MRSYYERPTGGTAGRSTTRKDGAMDYQFDINAESVVAWRIPAGKQQAQAIVADGERGTPTETRDYCEQPTTLESIVPANPGWFLVTVAVFKGDDEDCIDPVDGWVRVGLEDFRAWFVVQAKSPSAAIDTVPLDEMQKALLKREPSATFTLRWRP